MSFLTSARTLLACGAIAALTLAFGTEQAFARALGIDVSRWQNTINWTSVKGSGVTFAWAQATRGNYLTNNNYVANMVNGKAAGVIMGPYHYATPATNSAATEAAYFWARAGAQILADGKTLMPMLDIEEFNGYVGATSYSDWANQWATWVINKAASNGVNIKIVLYSSASFMCNFDSTCTGFGSWIANYSGDPQTGTPWSCCTSCNLWGGGNWNFWQYSSTGTVPGVSTDCDLDVFNGTFAEMTNAWKVKAMVAPVISGVTVANVGSSSALITWTTDLSSDSVVNYGLTTSYGSNVTNTTKVVNHSITLSGLSASTTYHFRVKSKNNYNQTATSGDFTFTTLVSGQVNDIIIDNTNATVTGTWSTGTSATDKFGTDYRYNGQGSGSSYLQYTPTILTAGNYQIYEWHSAGANRGTDTPHIITYNGGSMTLNVNQQMNGGAWHLLGTFNFATGTTGRVRITDGISTAGLISMADAVKFVYAQSAPNAPSGLSATSVSQTQINLAWADNSGNEESFVVRRSTTSGGPYTDIATLAANTTSYSNTGLSSGTTYYYVVKAVNAAGSSANSAQASATTQSSGPPNAPSGLTATAVSASQINLSWTDNSTDETSFIVARSATSGGPYSDIATLGANITSYSNTGLSASTTYYYVVRASNTGGSSANSAQASATTQATPPPAAPSGLVATAISQGEIDLSWTDNSSNESNFIIGRSTTSGGPYTDIATIGANTTAYANTGLAAGTAYYYVVRASNAGGSSANSAQASATTLPNPPSAPGGLAATAISSSQINLAWTDNSPNETSFVVARSTTSGGPYTDIATLAANSTSYSNTGLAAGTTYYYVVRAVNAGGSSGNSNEASATTSAGSPPNAPSGLTATATSSTQISLTWTDNSSDETGFRVEKSTDNVNFTQFISLSANATSTSASSLKGSTTYYFRVRSYNANGNSAYSAVASATTQPVADIIIDNPSATVTGTWSTGTGSTDKYGTDYRYKAGGTGTAYVTYTPTIVVGGNYQVYAWYPQGSNRTTVAPYVINYNGGSGSATLNQQINGGTWQSLGTFNFVAGTTGNVRVTDNYTGTSVVMADAIKFVYVP